MNKMKNECEIGMTNVELVLLFGPPFIGKTIYYHKHYAKTHCRIAASEIFEKDGSKNLRSVILKVVNILAKGKNVVIDDENWYKGTRKSYTTLVKQRVSNCTLTTVQFLPDVTFGYQQCLWMRQWAVAEWTLLDNDHEKRSGKIPASDEKLDCWFSRRRVTASTLNPPEFPGLSDNFSLITVRPDFVCNAPYKFSLPGLFVQWEAIIVDVDACSLNCKTGTVEFFNKWLNQNPCGRLLLIGPKLKNNNVILDEKVKLILTQLASQISYPVYFTFVDVKRQIDQYSKLPRPGTIAFLQKFHTISLNHKSTIYVYITDGHYKAASSLGIRTVKVEKLLANSQLVSAVFCGETTESLPFLKNLQEVHCGAPEVKSDLASGAPILNTAREPLIPFLSRAREGSSHLVWKYCYGKVNGICFKDKIVLERYQTQYALAAQPSLLPQQFSETLAKEKASRCPPAGSSSASKRAGSLVASTSKSMGRSNSNDSSSKDSIDRTFSLKNVNLREVAETPGRYRGGILCKEKIFNFNTEIVDNRLKISCNCIGSSDVTYGIHAFLTNSSGLASAHCSCPDSAGKVGRCKHVIGLLLYYQDRTTLTTSGAGQKKRNSSSKSTKKATAYNTPGSSGVNTVYLMSPEELVETAKEILSNERLLQQLSDHDEREEQQLIQASVEREEQNTSCPEEMEPSPDRNIKRPSTPDDLEELLFGEFKDKNVGRRKKSCPERLPSFVEETPPEDLPSSNMNNSNNEVTVIIPDSFVPETVSLVPETVQLATESLSRDPSLTSPRNDSANISKPRTNQSFEDFLDEFI